MNSFMKFMPYEKSFIKPTITALKNWSIISNKKK